MKVGLNGFGRTGRLIFRALYTRYPEHPVAAINDIAPPEFCAYLLKHDSVHRLLSCKDRGQPRTI